MTKISNSINALEASNGALSMLCFSGKTTSENVLPMFYPKKKNPRNLLRCKGFYFLLVGATVLNFFRSAALLCALTLEYQ